MGGHYVGDLLDICTHLIASSTKSAKYEEAAKRGMVVMHPDWVKDVWKRTIDDQKVQGVDKQFDKHKLPIFYGCCITTTGMSTAEKDLIKTLVEGNGGKYSGAFKSEDVDILIVSRERSDSEKFYHLLKTKGKAQVKIQNQTQTKRSGSRPKTAAV
jgi:ribosomal protein L19